MVGDHAGLNPIKSYGLPFKFLTGTIDMGTYATGGEDLSFDSFFNKGVVQCFIGNKDGYVFEYDPVNETVKAYYADYDASADGALIEVPNETDLSGVTDIPFFAVGY